MKRQKPQDRLRDTSLIYKWQKGNNWSIKRSFIVINTFSNTVKYIIKYIFWHIMTLCRLHPVSASKDFLKYFDRKTSYTDTVCCRVSFIEYASVVMFTFVDQYTFDSNLGGIHMAQREWDWPFSSSYLIGCLAFDLPSCFSPVVRFPIPFRYFKDLLISPVGLKMPS